MKRAALIITDGVIVDGVTLRNRDSIIEDLDGVVEHLWLETSEQLLADLRLLAEVAQDFAVWYGHGFMDGRPMLANEVLASAARVRALLPKEGQDGE